jgi:hypothetical protein
MKDNKFPAVFGGLMAVGVIGFGYFAFSSWSSLKKATTDYKKTSQQVTGLRQSKLFPDDSNLAAKIEQVDAYKASVDALQDKLVASQRALKDIKQQDFPKILLSAYEKTSAAASEAKITLPENFYFGMEVYKNGLPPAVACSLLEWELDGINFLTSILIDEGIISLDSITRDLTPVESADYGKETPGNNRGGNANASPRMSSGADGEVAYDPERVLDTYRFALTLTADHSAWERVLSRISNEKSFFYWIRYMRVENEKKEGPAKGELFTPIAVETPFAPAPEIAPEPPAPSDDPAADADPAAVTDPAGPAVEAAPQAQAMIDVREILGTEKIRASLVIDLVRFKPKDGSSEGESAAPAN